MADKFDLPKMLLADGKKHRLREAGLGDMFVIQRLLGQCLTEASTGAGLTRALTGAVSAEEFAGKLMMAIAAAGDEVKEWLDTFAPSGREPNERGELFSLLEYGRLLEALSDHPEILGFLESLQRLQGSQAAAVAASGLSKPGKS